MRRGFYLVFVGILVAISYFLYTGLSVSSEQNHNYQDKTIKTTRTESTEVKEDTPQEELQSHADLIKVVSAIRAQVKEELPVSFASIEITPGIEEGLTQLGRGAFEKYDYKLTLLARIDDCLKQDISQGKVRLFLIFDVDFDTLQGVGNGIDLIDSSLDEEETSEVLRCISASHDGFSLDFRQIGPVQGGKYYWSTGIAFPRGDDFIYRFIRSDGKEIY